MTEKDLQKQDYESAIDQIVDQIPNYISQELIDNVL